MNEPEPQVFTLNSQVPTIEMFREMARFVSDGTILVSRLEDAKQSVEARLSPNVKVRFMSHGRPVYTEEEITQKGWPYQQ